MADLFASGRLVDFILVVVVLEAAVLLLYWARARRGIAPLDLLRETIVPQFIRGFERASESSDDD